jgi:glycine cleavage system H protein
MSYEIPSDLRFMDSHEWVRVDDGTATVGISDFAQDELGDIVFVELPGEGDELTKDEDFGVVESIKAVSDVYAPVSGTITDTNDDLIDEPELVNEDPYGDGWMLKLDLADASELDDLFDADAYEDQLA